MSDVDDTSADSIVDEAIKLRDRGKEVEALELLSQILAKHPDSCGAHVIKGGLHWDREEFEQAEQCFTRASEISPKLEIASISLFHLRYRHGDKKAAVAEMRRFLSVARSAEYEKLAVELAKQLRGEEG